MHKNIYKSNVILIVLSILVLGTSMIGCKKQQNSKSEVGIVEESFVASNESNDTKVKASSDNTSVVKLDEKNNESKKVSDNKNEKAKDEAINGLTTVSQKQIVNTSSAQEKVQNITSALISTQPSTSTSVGTSVQPSSTSTSGTQQNQGTTTQTSQGQPTGSNGTTVQPNTGTTSRANGGTTQTGEGTTPQSNGGTTQAGGDPSTKPNNRTTVVTSDNVVAYASNFLGTKYLWGGTTPDGFDDSGFVQYVFKHFGIDVGRRTYDQIKAGTSVSKDQLKIGDLVFFGSAESPHHVGIYVGNNSYIHSPQTGDVVKISPLNRDDFVAVRRVF